MAHNIERVKEAQRGQDVGDKRIAPRWHVLDALLPHQSPEMYVGAKLWVSEQ